MTTLREAAQQALEALEMLAQPTKTNSETPRYRAHKAAITALRDALAQEEPVAWTNDWLFVSGAVKPSLPGEWHPLYTYPPRRTGLPHCEHSCEANAFQIEIRRLKAELAAERTACADICDQHASVEGIAQRCAEQIRARSKT
jgi:hypothetical protein